MSPGSVVKILTIGFKGKTYRYQERLRKVYFVLENILGSPVDGQGMTYSLKSQAGLICIVPDGCVFQLLLVMLV